MKKKFKIDEIYREKFRGIETTPPADSWENILAGLPEKKKNRILPLWYKLASTAAVLVIMLLLFKDFLFNTPQPSSSPVIVEQEREIFNPDPTSAEFEKYMREAGATLEAIKSGSENSKGRNDENQTPASPSGLADLPAASNEEETDPKRALPTAKIGTDSFTGVASSSNENVTRKPEKPLILSTRGSNLGLQPLIQVELKITTPEMMAKIPELTLPETIGKLKKDKAEDLVENTIFEDRFSLTTSAGAIYLGKFGKGNLLASQFSENTDKDKVTVSYGIHLGYQVSEKIKIRSGLKKVDFSYRTGDMSYLAVINSGVVSDPVSSTDGSLESSVGGSLDQGFGLLEIPLELEYGLINNKLELNLIVGASSFFLQENNISFSDGVNTADLGEGRNLNDLSFSANIGLGLNYHLTKSLQVNLEPLFKYQINTFDRSLNLDSYYLGIYSGLRFKF